LTVLVLALLGSVQIAYAWNPATSDLSGTNTDTDNSVAGALNRFNIDASTAGIQTGEDTDSLAFTIKMAASTVYYTSRPTTETIDSVVVSNAALARDGDTGTSASFEYEDAGTYQHDTFTTTTGSISSVSLYVRASTTLGDDDTYALSWSVGGTAGATLWAAGSSARSLQTYSWSDLTEPNDGTWEWADVGNFETTWTVTRSKGPDNAVVSVYEVWLIVTGYGYDATGMTANDQYEIDFTIGEEDFAMLFQATGAAAGTMKLFYRATGGGAWSDGETYVVGSITSGTPYQSPSDLGFTLTSSTATVGSVKLVVTKTILATLGATSNTVTGIFAANFAGGTGAAGSGGATPNDRSPSSGGASWTLSEAIPDFPHGTLVLMAPVISAYLVLRKRNGTGDA
jgi:hypothetical protein